MKQTVSILKALADANRLKIVAALSCYEELCACQVTELLQVTGATSSRHFSVLQNAKLVDSRKEGRWVYYRLTPTAKTAPVLEWLNSMLDESEEVKAGLKSLDKIVEITREDLCRKQRGEECCP